MNTDEIVRMLEQGWNCGEGVAWAAPFTDDAIFIDVVGRVQRGRVVIAREHQKLFDSIYRKSRLRVRVERSERLCTEVTLLNCVSELSVPDGPRAGKSEGIQTMVVRSGAIAHFHNTMRSAISDFAHNDSDLSALSPQDWSND